MSEMDRKWILSLGTTGVGSGVDPDIDVVTIEDPARGVRYEVVLGAEAGKPAVKRLVIEPLDEGGVMTQAILDRVPLRQLARQAQDFRAGELRNRPGAPVTMDTPRKMDRPSSEELAELNRQGMGRRELAERFQVSPKTADVWIKRARDLGLIAPSVTGRPRGSRGTR
ncbi:hypothetical protein ASD11_12225 [Aeromicrobium sp. Root495]|uniref:helix-turn-helix domain-containing protein n=1 Tax=Aeromicrobium sp. Root495 TaxID=1736550 RepID=UPI0006FD1897|nr:helix-turn-helix domain-containing protein [Aeromicrobium sp. Root495]KQY60228.1 hypothetical protein ASD11_12225 [Aeromicrobium sp. Root495]